MRKYNQDPKIERFDNDAEFHRLVIAIQSLLQDHNFSYLDLRDAIALACIRYERQNPSIMTWAGLSNVPKESK